MNLHVPQSIQTSVELKYLARVARQIILAGNSKPCIGSKQDTLMGSYKLTLPETKVDWKHAMTTIASTSLKGKFLVEKGKTYTGAELFSLLLPNDFNMQTDKIKIKNGKLESGLIGSGQIGTTKNNIIHKLLYQYGNDVAKKYIDDLQKMILSWLLISGFTIGPRDFETNKECYNKLQNLIEAKKLEINHLITEAENNPDIMDKALFEKVITAELQVISTNQIEPEIVKNLPNTNNFKMCVESGSNGKVLNLGQVIIAVGQQVVEGKRIKRNFNGRSLAYFHRDDDSAFACGFCSNSFIKGLTLPEFMFHTMAGREGVIDTAIKTADKRIQCL